jgi:hypothetical protein
MGSFEDGLIVGTFLLGFPLGVFALWLWYNRPQAKALGDALQGETPSGFSNNEEIEVVEDEKGDIKKMIIHRKVERVA